MSNEIMYHIPIPTPKKTLGFKILQKGLWENRKRNLHVQKAFRKVKDKLEKNTTNCYITNT
jgi:hypothetical protein